MHPESESFGVWLLGSPHADCPSGLTSEGREAESEVDISAAALKAARDSGGTVTLEELTADLTGLDAMAIEKYEALLSVAQVEVNKAFQDKLDAEERLHAWGNLRDRIKGQVDCLK